MGQATQRANRSARAGELHLTTLELIQTAVLIARIYEVFPLVCPMCGGQMRLIAFVTEGTQIRRLLDHIGVGLRGPPQGPRREAQPGGASSRGLPSRGLLRGLQGILHSQYLTTWG